MSEKRKTWLKRGAWLIAGLLVFVAVIIGGVLAALQTEAGSRWVSETVAATVSSEDFTLKLEGLGPGLPFQVRLAGFSLADREGVWLTGRGLEADFRLWDLIHSRINVPRLHLKEVVFSRAPKSEPSKDEEVQWPESLSFPKVAVADLRIEKAVLSPPFTTPAKTYTAWGDALTEGPDAEVRLQVNRLDGPADMIDLEAGIKGPAGDLKVSLRLNEAPGGLIGQLAGFPPDTPISARLTGQGPLADWQGILKAQAGESLAADAEINLKAGLVSQIGLKGSLAMAQGILPVEVEELVGRQTRFQVNLTFNPAKEDYSLGLKSLELKTERLALSANGRLGLADSSVAGSFRLTAEDMSFLSRAYGVNLENGRVVEGVVSGDLLTPEIRLKSDQGRVACYGVSSDNLSFDLRVVPIGFWNGLKVRGTSRITGFQAGAPGMAPSDMNLDLETELPGFESLKITRFDLDGGWTKVQVTGSLDFDTLGLEAKAGIEVSDLKRQAMVGGFNVSGQGGFNGSISGTWPEGYKAEITGNLTNIDGLPEDLALLAGPKVDLSTRALITPEAIDVETAEIKAASTISSSGRLDLTDSKFGLSYRIQSAGLTALLKKYGVLVQEAAVVTGTFDGPFDSPRVTAETGFSNLVYSEISFTDLKIKASAENLGPEPLGQVSMSGAGAGQPLTAGTNWSIKDDLLVLKKLKAEIPGASLTGETSMALSSLLVNGRAKLEARDLAPTGSILGQKMAGAVDLDITLKPEGGRQSVSAKGQVRNLKIAELAAEKIDLSASIPDLKDVFQGQAEITAQGLATGELTGTRVKAALKNLKGRPRITAEAKGVFRENFTLETTADLAGPGEPFRVTVASLSAKFGGRKIKLARPAVWETQSGGGWRLSDLDLKLATGQVRGQGALTPGQADLSLTAEAIPLSLLALAGFPDLTGTLSGDIRTTGRPDAPKITAGLHFKGIGDATSTEINAPAANADVNLNIEQGALNVTLKVTGLGPKPGTGQASFPVKVSLLPFAFEAPENGRLTGGFKTDLDLSLVPVLLSLDGHEASGRASVDLDLQGTLAAPQVDGRVLVEKGHYENVRLGMILDDISAEIEGHGDEIKIVRTSATDGGTGRVTATGSLEMDPQKEYPFQMAVVMQKAELMRLDNLKVRADGNAELSGSTSKAKLNGAVTLDPVEVKIPEDMSTSTPDLEVKVINAGENEEVEDPTGQTLDVELDMDLKMPGRFFLRGAGLDSEWQGTFHLGGSSSAPRVTGSLNVVRGHYDFLGKRFDLASGSLTFSGSSPPAPWIDLTCTSKANDITATIRLTGSPSDPQLTLTSDPSLPQDEILARILFGKDLSSISPIQALRLAQEARKLAGMPSGPDLDILGKSREALGLDNLDIVTGDSGGTAVSAGKYIGERIYVKAEAGQDPQDQKVVVEIELTPNLSLETEVGADAQGGVGLSWKMDY